MTSFFIPKGLKVREVDASPSVIATELVFPNDSLSVSGSVITVQSSGVTDGSKGGVTVSDDGATWTVTTNANLTGHITSVGNATVLGSFTKAQLDAAVSDGNVLFVGDVTSNATHTGDVTGATALTIANDAVTYAKMQNVSAASRLLGRGSAGGAGDIEELSLGSGLTMSGTTLSASGGIGGSTGATDNRILRSDGTGGATAQNSAVTIDDSGNVTGVAGLTASGTISSTANGAASTPASTLVGTWFTGGTGTTTKPQLLVEPTGTTSTGWSTSGTGIGVNAASGFTGNLLDLQLAGVSQFRIGNGSLSISVAGSTQMSFNNSFIEASRQILPSSTSVNLGAASNRWGQIFVSQTGIRVGDGTNGARITASGTSPNESLVLTPAGTGVVSVVGNITASGTIQAGTYTVGTLPSAAANTRAAAFVTDSNLAYNSTNLGSTVTAGGANLIPVWSNGTNWVIG